MRGNFAGNFCLLGMETFQSPQNTVKVLRLQRPLNLLIVSVTTGAVDVWFGEYSGSQPTTPHLHFGQTNTPVWLPLPEMITDLTLVASGLGTNKATVIVGGK